MLKKYIFLFTALIAISCSSDDDLSSPEYQPDLVEKNIEFLIFTDRNFSDSRFDDAFVKVEMVLLKENLGGGNQITIFKKSMDWTHFRDFPKETDKMVEQQKVIYDRKTEILYISYGLYYNVNGMRSSEATAYSPSPVAQTEYVEIKL